MYYNVFAPYGKKENRCHQGQDRDGLGVRACELWKDGLDLSVYITIFKNGKPSISMDHVPWLCLITRGYVCIYICATPKEYILKNLIPLCKYALTSLNVRSVLDLEIRIIQVVHCMSQRCSQNRAKTGDSSRKPKVRSLIYGSKMWKPCTKLIQIGLLWD